MLRSVILRVEQLQKILSVETSELSVSADGKSQVSTLKSQDHRARRRTRRTSTAVDDGMRFCQATNLVMLIRRSSGRTGRGGGEETNAACVFMAGASTGLIDASVPSV
jgi:hypothetical protein